MDRQAWLGLDFGTSSLKAVLVGRSGAVKARSSARYSSSSGPGRAAEQDPDDYLAATARVIADCGVADAELVGIGLAGQTPTLVLVDADGESVRPAMTWQDRRAEAEAAELATEYPSAEQRYRLFGTDLAWTAAYPPAKLLWLARHEPATVRRTRWALQPKDFVGLRLTGSPQSDPWSSKGLCNVLDQSPADEALERSGWRREVVPPLAPAWVARGIVSDAAAARFGLRAGVPVAVGWSDALAAMLAVGAFDEATGFVLSGTSSIVGISCRSTPAQDARSLLTIPSTCAPLPVVYGPTQSSGASLEWLARLLGCTVQETLALASRGSDNGAAPPVFVPYLAGERAPVWSADARGTILGLSPGDGAAEIARAVVNGVCMSERHVLSTAERALGGTAPVVRVAGKGASGQPWRNARLEAAGRPLHFLDEADASALGAAMLGAAAGDGGDLSGATALRPPFDRADPDAGQEDHSTLLYERYLAASGVSLAWAGTYRRAAPDGASAALELESE